MTTHKQKQKSSKYELRTQVESDFTEHIPQHLTNNTKEIDNKVKFSWNRKNNKQNKERTLKILPADKRYVNRN